MKAHTPVFIHSQHPAKIFGLPPAWHLVGLASASTLYFFALSPLLPEFAFLIGLILWAMFLIFLKIKLGKDRHSDRVWFATRSWIFRHRSGRLCAGDEQ